MRIKFNPRPTFNSLTPILVLFTLYGVTNENKKIK